MSSIATKVAGRQLKKAMQGNDSGFAQIDWKNFNYPPFINVFHYDIGHIKEEERDLVKKLNFWFIGQILFFVLNFINAIVQTAVGLSWTRIPSSIFWYAVVIGLAGFGFYNVFRAFCGDNGNAMLIWKITWGTLAVLFLFQFLIDKICWNSVVRFVRLFKAGHGFAGFLSMIEWLLMGANIGALVFLVLEVRKTGRWNK
jgi:hypothetical protein